MATAIDGTQHTATGRTASSAGCKPKWLKAALNVGSKMDDDLIRRLDVSGNPAVMANAAFTEGAKAMSAELKMRRDFYSCSTIKLLYDF